MPAVRARLEPATLPRLSPRAGRACRDSFFLLKSLETARYEMPVGQAAMTLRNALTRSRLRDSVQDRLRASCEVVHDHVGPVHVQPDGHKGGSGPDDAFSVPCGSEDEIEGLHRHEDITASAWSGEGVTGAFPGVSKRHGALQRSEWPRCRTPRGWSCNPRRSPAPVWFRTIADLGGRSRRPRTLGFGGRGWAESATYDNILWRLCCRGPRRAPVWLRQNLLNTCARPRPERP